MTAHGQSPRGPEGQPWTDTGDGTRNFPAGFVWGAATSAYQIEGAVTEGGRGPSIWDAFTHTPGRTHAGHTGDVAADHYHRYNEDVELMRQLGLHAYRFSVSWPRIQPSGPGAAHAPGLDFYRDLVDRLLAAGIEPWITLYHWDLPLWAHEAGGWTARDTAKRFAEYAALVHHALGDRVRYWTTLNEPWCSAFLGYGSGEHAPGVRDHTAAIPAAHHLLLGHGLAMQALRGQSLPGQQLGITLNLYPVTPATPAPEDREAARWVDGLQNRLFLEPLLLGRYPDDVREDVARVTHLDFWSDGDERIVAEPVDLLGVNYYTRHVVRGQPADRGHVRARWPREGPPVRFVTRGQPVTEMGWEIDSEGLTEVLTRLHRNYPPVPLYVTENGAAFDECVIDGHLTDAKRVAYLWSHLRAAHDALSRGVDLRGYFLWSLLDNFEWAHGYTKRFGIVHVDFCSGQRRPKDSYHWYRDVVARNALDVGER